MIMANFRITMLYTKYIYIYPFLKLLNGVYDNSVRDLVCGCTIIIIRPIKRKGCMCELQEEIKQRF